MKDDVQFYLLSLWIQRFALHGYPAAVYASCFV